MAKALLRAPNSFLCIKPFFNSTVVRHPFSEFERRVLIEVNVAPTQLHPNSWAFVWSSEILEFLGMEPSLNAFLSFKQGGLERIMGFPGWSS